MNAYLLQFDALEILISRDIRHCNKSAALEQRNIRIKDIDIPEFLG